ncbi:MAG: trigger factor [Acidobacteria bacterium]|nr:trigger factor [Acidobacteriota bacterium]
MIPNENEVATPAVAENEEQHTQDHAHDHDHDHEHHHHGPTLNADLTREISVEVPAEDVSKAFDKTTKRYQKLARIPGFRPGKVPASVIKTKFANELRQDVMDSLVNERFRAELESQNLRPVSQPQIQELNLVDGQPLRFRAAFEVLPDVNVEGYNTVSVQKPTTDVTDEEFQGEIDYMMNQHATVETVEEDRTLQEGDSAEISFKGKIQELAQTVGEEGLESQSQEEPITGDDVIVDLGGRNTLPAFTQALTGAKVGQELTAEVVYPADFGEPRLAGKTVEYDITVKSIKKKTYPEKNDEFAKTLGNYESWSDFETKMRENLAGRKKSALEGRAKEQLVDELVKKFDFPVPETFVQQQIDMRLDRGLRALAQQGMSPEQMRQMDFNRLRAAQRDEAVKEVKASLILDKIAEAENVDVADSELDRELFMLSLQQREPIDQLRERLQKDGTINRIREQMRREKVTTALYEKFAA